MKKVKTLHANDPEGLDGKINDYRIDDIKLIGSMVVHAPTHTGARTTFYQQILILD